MGKGDVLHYARKQMKENDWTTVITSQKRWFNLNLGELWQYRDLIMLFVRRDFVTVYKQTILGPFWFLLQPVVSMIIFTVVFGKIIGISTKGVPQPLFYLSGIVVWNFFASCFTRTSDVLVANAGIFGKVYFPRLAVPVATVIGNFITFLIQFVLFIIILMYFKLTGWAIKPNALVALVPILVAQMAALGLGIGILVSSMTTKYRDLAFMTGFAVQLWMYATPIVYPLEMVPQAWQWLYALNPMTAVIETFRQAFWGSGHVDVVRMSVSIVETGALLLLAIGVFNRVEKNFMDTV
jgi:lipopolysaccharide transport system permease protein